MSVWVLDTDTLTLWRRGEETVAAQFATTLAQQLAVTIITVEEILGSGIPKPGKHTMINSWLRPIKCFTKPWNLPEAFSSCRSTYQRFAAIASCVVNIVASVRMICASPPLSWNNKGF
jgi:hypothetical protein